MRPLAKSGKLLPSDAISALACASRCPVRDMLEKQLRVLSEIPRKDIYSLVHDRHSTAVREWLDKLEANAAPQAGKPRTAPTIAEEHPEKPAVAAPKEFTFAASYKNGYETAIETAAQHVEGQLCVWDHTGVITAHVLQTIAKNIRALKDAPQPRTTNE